MRELVGTGKPFHSALDKAAGLLKRKVGTGAEFMQELKALGGVKQAEIDERKLGELMGMPKMTQEQFLAELGNRPLPAIREKVFGEELSPEELAKETNNFIRAQARRYASNNSDNSREYRVLAGDEMRRLRGQHLPSIREHVREEVAAQDEPEHEKWTLPGGDNYREMLIKSPKGMEEFPGVDIHFRGEPGILASMRLKDRLIPDNEGPHSVKVIGGGGTSTVKHPTREAAERFADVKRQGGYRTEITPLSHKKLLHLEELQSDWHQQGRKEGYKTFDPELKAEQLKELKKAYDELNKRRWELHEQAKQEPDAGPRFDSLMEEANSITPKLLELNSQMHSLEHFERQQRDAVPNAPFKNNWEEMALKRLVHHAAEKGYHGIVVTPGKEQADRYSLAKHLDALHYNPDTHRLIGKRMAGC